jgi:alpha-1,2-mannosyltransferase
MRAARVGWFAAGLLALTQVYAVLSRPVADRLTDLHVYLGAANQLYLGGSLYDYTGREGAPFTYPPFAGLLFVPVADLDESLVGLLWTVLTLVVVGLIAVLVARLDGVPAPVVAAVLLASAPIFSDVRFGQVSILLALLILFDVSPWMPERYRGVLIGVAAAIKLTPLIFIPMLWFGGRRRAAVTAAASFAGCTLLACAMIPAESARYWLHEIWDLERVGHIATNGNQSLTGALLRLGLADGYRAVLVALGALVVGVLALWWSARAARADRWLTATVIVGAASVVISPVSWTHHQIWLLLAAFLTISHRQAVNRVWAAVVIAVMVAPVTSWGAGLPGVLGIAGRELRLVLALAIACFVPCEIASHERRPAAMLTEE